MWLGASLALVLLAACADNPAVLPLPPPPQPMPMPAPVQPPAPPAAPAPAATPAPAPAAVPAPAPAAAAVATPGAGTLQAYLEGLKAVSCPAGVRKQAPEAIGLKVSKVSLSMLNPSQKTVGALSYVAGFHLTSTDKRFGGLSGLDFLDDGNLLAESDEGTFVWIDLGKDGVTPVAARIARMRDATGAELTAKRDADAEDVTVNGGMALVSFERNDRVLAYDLGDCGAAARGAPIVYGGFGRSLREAYRDARLDVGENSGPEPLAVTKDWMLFIGLETLDDGQGPLSARAIEAPPSFDLRIEKGAPSFVSLALLPAGKDGRDVRAFSLHRGFDGVPSITISESYLERYVDQANLPARVVSEINERSHERFRVKSTRRLAQLSILEQIDNFEGIAAKQLPDGTVRLFIISDDNFSDAQRTLLEIYDLKK